MACSAISKFSTWLKLWILVTLTRAWTNLVAAATDLTKQVRIASLAHSGGEFFWLEETTRTRNVTGLPTRCMAAEPWKRVNVKTIHGKEFINHSAGLANLASMAAKAGCTTIPVSTKARGLDRLG